MAQVIESNDIFGKIGRGFGQGLGEQVPKEMQHARLSQGLKQLSETNNLSPRQFWAQANSIYGISPEQQRQAGEFARMEAQGNALRDLNTPRSNPNPFTNIQPRDQNQVPSKFPSITQEQNLEKIQEGYIPPTKEDIYRAAGEEYNANPAKFGNDPQKAIDYAEDAAIKDEKRNEAYSKQHEILDNIQKNIVDRLRKHSDTLGVDVPANIYNKIEDKAIKATKPISKGGRGITEQQAMKESGDELDAVSRDYKAIKPLVSGWSITGRPGRETLSSLSSIQKKFKERGDLENFADKLISEGNFSPMKAFSIAEPVTDYPQVNNYIKTLPEVRGDKYGDIERDTLKISPKLAQLIKDTGASPLSIASELKKKNYDPKEFLKYISDHRLELNLSEEQGRQLDKPRNFFGTFNDWWTDSWSGK